MKILYLLFIFAAINLFSRCENDVTLLYPKEPVRFSQDFILYIKSEMPYQAFRDTLAHLDLEKLNSDLNTSDKKLAFWINTYNSMVQAKIRDDVDAFEDQDAFFKTANQNLGNIKVSLDQIETGILRKKKTEGNTKFTEKFQVDKLDPRIHFTLNCGATSCPPIAFYSAENLDKDLATAEESFVSQTCKYDAASNTLELSELFKWFEEDFGGKDGVLNMMVRLNIISDGVNPTIQYTPYNWNLDLDNF